MKFTSLFVVLMLLLLAFVAGETFGKMQAIEALVPSHGLIDCFVPDPPRSLRVAFPR